MSANPFEPQTAHPAHALTVGARRRQALARAMTGAPTPAPTQSPPAPRINTLPHPAQPIARPRAASDRPTAPTPRTTNTRRTATTVIALAGASLLFAVIAVALTLSGNNDAAAPPSRDTPPLAQPILREAPPVAPSTDQTTRAAATPDEQIDSSNVVRAMRRASYEYGSDPRDALRRFESAVRVLAESWTSLDLAQRLASLELAVEFLIRSADPAWSEDAQTQQGRQARAAAFAGVDALLARDALDPAAVSRGVWSAGLATRLLRERSASQTLIDEAAVRAGAVGAPADHGSVTATFELGAQAALRLAADKLAAMATRGDPASREAWSAWDQALDVATATNPGARQRIALHALDSVIQSVSARPNDTASRDRLTSLLAQCDWSSTGKARSALLDWLDDPSAYSTAALAVVTQWLAANSEDSGLGVNDTLSSAASGYQRSDVRGRLASRWSSGQPMMAASILDRWSRAADELLRRPSPGASDPVEWLRDAAAGARLARAAALLWRGENEAARVFVDDPDATRAQTSTNPPRLDALAPKADDGQFALRFLSASQNAQTRIDLLRDLVGRARELGSIDAEVVFEQSMFGTPSEVRRIAKRIVELRADDPAMINAGLEMLPRSPRTTAMQEVYEAVTTAILPPIDDPAWEPATRSALVARLLDIMTGGAALDPADALAASLGESYTDRAGTSPNNDLSPVEAAEQAVLALLSEARATGGIAAEAEIAIRSRRFDARRALAADELQRFAVESSNAAEALALLIGLERAEHRAPAEEVVERLRESLASAASSAAQIRFAERASVELWAIRLGEQP